MSVLVVTRVVSLVVLPPTGVLPSSLNMWRSVVKGYVAFCSVRSLLLCLGKSIIVCLHACGSFALFLTVSGMYVFRQTFGCVCVFCVA